MLLGKKNLRYKLAKIYIYIYYLSCLGHSYRIIQQYVYIYIDILYGYHLDWLKKKTTQPHYPNNFDFLYIFFIINNFLGREPNNNNNNETKIN